MFKFNVGKKADRFREPTIQGMISAPIPARRREDGGRRLHSKALLGRALHST